MGTDVTVFLEVAWPGPGFVGNYEDPALFFSEQLQLFSGRNYGMFNYMAGVRGFPESEVVPLRGLPSNLSFAVSEAFLAKEQTLCSVYAGCEPFKPWPHNPDLFYKPFYHNHTWLLLPELMSAYASALREDKRLDLSYEGLIKLMEIYEDGGAVSRVVIAFDS